MTASQLYITSRKMPFIRLLIAFASGIVLQWYLLLTLPELTIIFIAAFVVYASSFFLRGYQAFRFQWLRGVPILMMFLASGGFISYSKNPLHQKDNYTHVYRAGDAIVATVNEALLEKAKTCKANATVNGVYHNRKYIDATGTIIIYFDKDNLNPKLNYGSQILFTNPLQEVKNTGNPGAVDYQRYLLFQGVTATAYVKNGEYLIVNQNRGSSFYTAILKLQQYILQTLQRFIPRRKEQGVAEALLIGYRNDLDKPLLQSYTNTGVVHIIAISGLHLGMIYGFILLIFSRYKTRKWYRIVMPVTAIIVLWTFTLLAGAVPSILRSAVTFSFVVLGVAINRKGSIYNTLAASAFCLLAANPYIYGMWVSSFPMRLL